MEANDTVNRLADEAVFQIEAQIQVVTRVAVFREQVRYRTGWVSAC